jgi:hypothetical protein
LFLGRRPGTTRTADPVRVPNADGVPMTTVRPKAALLGLARLSGLLAGCGPTDQSTRLLGRSTELRVLRTILEDVAAGTSAALCVTGDPGIGKSALLAEAGRIAVGAGISVRTVCGFGDESEIPYARGCREAEARLARLLGATRTGVRAASPARCSGLAM